MIPRKPAGEIDWLILEGYLLMALMLAWIAYAMLAQILGS